MGLLDALDSEQGRLGLGLLMAAGPQAQPMSLGQRLGQGLGYVQAQKAQDMESRMKAMQMQQAQMQQAQLQSQMQDELTARQLAGKYMVPGQPGLAPLVGDKESGILPSAGREAVPSSFDYAGYATALANAGMPQKALAIQGSLVKETPFDKISTDKFTPESLADFQKTRNYGVLKPRDKLEFVEGVGVNPYDPKNAGRAVPNPNKPFSLSPTGEVLPNNAYQQYEIGKAKAGATNVSTKVENKMGESIAGQVGPMVKDTYTAAQGAVQQLDAAGRIIKAVDSGKIIAGPLANARMKVSQIGQILGVSGKNDAEIIARSRDVIRGLSEMTLQGRKQMTGQGAITESESKLAEKANSGDIADLTPAEIKQLARASARAAKFVYQQHADNLENLQSDPNTANLGKFYKVRPMPAVDTEEEPAGWSIKKVPNGKL
jgi:hypothetical protein